MHREHCRIQKVGNVVQSSHKAVCTGMQKQMTIKICMNKIIKKFSLMDIENELNLISCHRCKTVSKSTNQITQGTKYIQSVREGSQSCHFIYKRPTKYHSGSLWKLWRMRKRKNITQRSWVQFPATTRWFVTIFNGIWCPLLVCLKAATVYSHTWNK